MIVHDGKSIPKFTELWDTGDKEFVWFVWDDFLRGATISTSTWTVPTGWTVHSQVVSASVTDSNNVVYNNASSALLSTTATEGTHIITNRIVLSDNRAYER